MVFASLLLSSLLPSSLMGCQRLLALVVLASEPASTAVPQLTLQQAEELTQQLQPQLRQARAQMQSQRSLALYSWSQLLPQLNGQLAYSRSTANFSNTPGSVPTSVAGYRSPTLGLSYDYYNLGISATQLIYDFGYTYNQYAAADLTAHSLEATDKSTLVGAILQVRNAYFSARAAKANVGVAHENLANQQRHRAQIESNVRVGKRPEIDLLQARTDYSNARVQSIAADANYRIARAQLNQAIGREGSIDFEVSDETFAPVDVEDREVDAMLASALQARPDYVAAELAVLAQQRTAASSRGQYLPSISASGSLSDAGQSVNNLAWNWKVGVALNWSLFGSGETYYTVAAAQWTAVALQAQRDGLRQQVRLDLEQAHVSLTSSRESLDASNDALANAKQLLAQAEGRYAAGISSVIELGDAQVAYTKASAQRVAAEYQLASARANLLRALGRYS